MVALSLPHELTAFLGQFLPHPLSIELDLYAVTTKETKTSPSGANALQKAVGVDVDLDAHAGGRLDAGEPGAQHVGHVDLARGAQ